MAFDYASLDFGDFVQQVAGQTMEAATAATFTKPFDIQAMQMQTMGQYGSQYVPGQPTNNARPGTINPMYLLMGAGLLAVMMMKD